MLNLLLLSNITMNKIYKIKYPHKFEFCIKMNIFAMYLSYLYTQNFLLFIEIQI